MGRKSSITDSFMRAVPGILSWLAELWSMDEATHAGVIRLGSGHMCGYHGGVIPLLIKHNLHFAGLLQPSAVFYHQSITNIIKQVIFCYIGGAHYNLYRSTRS
ncbi:hypothetical protein GDO78_016952 [Eleutherodactylus coqui]|uniref:Uncharacterized protein n=1 Tax=Eleutherodactylus coqui TaxID=57060 RepID=A0A8J6EQ18_ELECQ|nr:hypothetical protein GDO78_016952 [Eleutherodactylus coqui]